MDDAVRTLRLFNEKVDKLMGLRFTEALKRNITVTRVWTSPGVSTTSRTGPEAEETEAFVLTLRFFVQNNERISIANMATLWEGLSVSEDLKEAVRKTRRQLNEFLDSKSEIVWNNEKLLRRQILDVFLYGSLAHANREKKETFDQWASDSNLLPHCEAEFIYICSGLLQALVWMRTDNKKALSETRPSRPPGRAP